MCIHGHVSNMHCTQTFAVSVGLLSGLNLQTGSCKLVSLTWYITKKGDDTKSQFNKLCCHQGCSAAEHKQDDCPQSEYCICTNSDACTWSHQMWWPAWDDIRNICSWNHDYSSASHLHLSFVSVILADGLPLF